MLSNLRIAINGFSVFSACLFFIILASVLFTGCQTAATRKATWIRTNLKESAQRSKECFEYIENKPAYQNLFSRLPRSNKITPMQMADTSRPTAEDVTNIIAVYNEDAQCRKLVIEDMSRIVPSFVPIFINAYRTQDLVTADLIERKISLGEANKRRSEIKSDTEAKLRAEESSLKQELKMAHSAEISNRQAIGLAVTDSLSEWGKQQQALADRLQDQQLIDSLNRPKSTNCQVFGNTVNCTTY